MIHPADPLISVVVPTRNRVAYLKEALASVRNQTTASWECIVVDDGSTDGTWEWLASQSDTRVGVIRNARPGERSAARNRGLAEARGRFVLFLDDDDRLRPNALMRLARSLLSDPSCFAAVGAIVAFDQVGGRRRRPHPRVPLVRSVWQDVLLGWCGLQGRSMIRTTTIRDVGGWGQAINIAEDHDLWLRLCLEGKVAFIPDVVLEHRIHAEQRTVDVRKSLRRLRARFVDGLPDAKRPRGLSLLHTFDRLQDADSKLRAGHFKEAVGNYVKGLASTPAALVSPIVRPIWMVPLSRALFGWFLGATAFSVARKVKQHVDAVIGRRVGS